MNFKLLILVLNAIAIAIFAHHTYMGILVPAWAALGWCISASLHDLEKYLETT